VACAQTSRRFVGVELEGDYVAQAIDRIRDVMAPSPSLFEASVPGR